MDLFHEIEGAVAILRLPKGVFKQVKMFHRGQDVYVAAAGGYVRVGPWLGNRWGTTHPSVFVEDIDTADGRVCIGNPTRNVSYAHD